MMEDQQRGDEVDQQVDDVEGERVVARELDVGPIREHEDGTDGSDPGTERVGGGGQGVLLLGVVEDEGAVHRRSVGPEEQDRAGNGGVEPQRGLGPGSGCGRGLSGMRAIMLLVFHDS